MRKKIEIEVLRKKIEEIFFHPKQKKEAQVKETFASPQQKNFGKKICSKKLKKDTTTPSHPQAQPYLFGLQPYLIVLP